MVNYIYDILLDFQDQLFDFYEWSEKDKITHVRKIPCFVVNEDLMFKMLNYDFILSDEFLKKIDGKTEVFLENQSHNKKLDYAFLIVCMGRVIAILYDGNEILRSSLQLEEEEEVLETMNSCEKTDIDIKITNESIFPFEMTRESVKKKDYIMNKIEVIKLSDDLLKYIALEIFNDEKIKPNEILKKIKSCTDSSTISKIYDLLKLSKI